MAYTAEIVLRVLDFLGFVSNYEWENLKSGRNENSTPISVSVFF